MASLYPIIKEDILKNIKAGVYPEDQMLPPERELTEIYQVSRMTIRRALDELISDGFLIRKSGSGVFIAKTRKTRSLAKASIQSDQEIIDAYGKISVKVIECKTVINHPLANHYLKIEEDEEIYEVKRIQYGGKTPIVYEKLFLPKRYFDSLENVDFKKRMREIVETKIKVEMPVNRSIDVQAISASKKISTYLEVPKNAPILQITIIERDQAYHPLYCGINSFDGTEFKYTTD